jgi:hypothetical protein
LSGVIAATAIISKLDAMASGITSMLTAAAGHPLALAGLATVVAGTIVYKTYSDNQRILEQQVEAQRDAQNRHGIFQGGKTLQQMRDAGYSEGDIRKAFLGTRSIEAFAGGAGIGGGLSVKVGERPEVDYKALAEANTGRHRQISRSRWRWRTFRLSTPTP